MIYLNAAVSMKQLKDIMPNICFNKIGSRSSDYSENIYYKFFINYTIKLSNLNLYQLHLFIKIKKVALTK